MKLISVALRPRLLAPFLDAVTMFGVRGFTVSHVYCASADAGPVQVYRGQRVSGRVRPLLRIELVTMDEDAPDLVHVISQIAAGRGDDARRIWVSDVLVFTRIANGAYGADAL